MAAPTPRYRRRAAHDVQKVFHYGGTRETSQRHTSFGARQRVLIARSSKIAKVEMAGELGEEVVRLRDLPLHLLNLEIRRDARRLSVDDRCK